MEAPADASILVHVAFAHVERRGARLFGVAASSFSLYEVRTTTTGRVWPPEARHPPTPIAAVAGETGSAPSAPGQAAAGGDDTACATEATATAAPATTTAVVVRRYSDFEWLKLELGRAVAGAVVPALPEKAWSGRFEPAFIEARRHGLEAFLTKVTRYFIFIN